MNPDELGPLLDDPPLLGDVLALLAVKLLKAH